MVLLLRCAPLRLFVFVLPVVCAITVHNNRLYCSLSKSVPTLCIPVVYTTCRERLQAARAVVTIFRRQLV